VRLAVVHNYLYHPEIMAARAIVDSGELGDVRVVIVNFLGVVDSPGAESYRPRWRHDPAAAGGGVLMDMLHAVYVAEHLLGASAQRVSAYVDTIRSGDAVEDLALCRFEADHQVALVNMGWGFGPGGVSITGTEGRLTISYRDGGTPPWAPFERLDVTTAAGTRVESTPAGKDLEDHLMASMGATLRDVGDAIVAGTSPRTGGRQALHTLEATLAAYQSAALGTSVALPLQPGSPVFDHGVTGLRKLEGVPEWSPVKPDRIFGFDDEPAQHPAT
jgi:predicted dehydrogenase